MERLICMSAGAIIAVCAFIYFVKLLILKFTGFETDAEVTAIKEYEHGSFVHTLKFRFNGEFIEKDDKTGYSQPFSKGEIKKIVCSKKIPDKFEYANALQKNIAISGVLIVMSVLIVIRFAFFVVE